MTASQSGQVSLFPSRVSHIWLKWEEATNRVQREEKKYSISLWENSRLRGIFLCFTIGRARLGWYLSFCFFTCRLRLVVFMWRSTGKTYGKKWAQERGTDTQCRAWQCAGNKQGIELVEFEILSLPRLHRLLLGRGFFLLWRTLLRLGSLRSCVRHDAWENVSLRPEVGRKRAILKLI